MRNSKRNSRRYEKDEAEPSDTAEQPRDVPRITIDDPDQTRTVEYHSASSTETEMSSSRRYSSTSRGKQASKSKSKKDDWSKITDPEERRRVQNRIAQRKFRDKAKETKERQERDAENRACAHLSYNIPDPSDMGPEDFESGLPWGSMSLSYVFSKGRAKENESRHGSKSQEEDAHYEVPQVVYDDQDGYYEESPSYEDGDQAYYDYASAGSSGSAHGGSSR